MNKHQRAWLKANPHRSTAWLRERLADGFDVHHVDGNRDNNDPLNLLLVEVMDHMRLHDLPLQRILASKIKSDKKKIRDDNDDARGIKRGSFISKTIKGRVYWYFQETRTRKQHYVGVDSVDIRKTIDAHSKFKDSDDHAAAWNLARALVMK